MVAADDEMAIVAIVVSVDLARATLIKKRLLHMPVDRHEVT